MADPKHSDEIHKRKLIVVRAIRDGCPDCPDEGLMCEKHLRELRPLFTRPRQRLKAFEDRLFSDQSK